MAEGRTPGDAGMEIDPTKPGFVTVVLNSRGMIGNGPDWEQNPHCKLVFSFLANNGLWSKVPPNAAIRAEFGRQPETVRKEFWVDHGFTEFTIAVTFIDPETRQWVRQGMTFNSGGRVYAIVP